MAVRILLVDDEPLILKGLRFALQQDGYEIDQAQDGEEAISKILAGGVDLVLLDVMLPKFSGIEVCQRVRDEGVEVPIIMLTAKGEDMDKILGLEYGADDYMTKPFNILEVKARIKTILRRTATKKDDNRDSQTFSFGDLVLDTRSRSVTVEGNNVNLTVREFDLLHLFISTSGKVFNREQLLELVWGYDYLGDNRTVDVHIRRLREKIEPDPAKPKYILTKWGVGYYFANS